jgi:hypothetical protein
MPLAELVTPYDLSGRIVLVTAGTGGHRARLRTTIGAIRRDGRIYLRRKRRRPRQRTGQY